MMKEGEGEGEGGREGRCNVFIIVAAVDQR